MGAKAERTLVGPELGTTFVEDDPSLLLSHELIGVSALRCAFPVDVGTGSEAGSDDLA
jgi:hypothetical protein